MLLCNDHATAGRIRSRYQPSQRSDGSAHAALLPNGTSAMLVVARILVRNPAPRQEAPELEGAGRRTSHGRATLQTVQRLAPHKERVARPDCTRVTRVSFQLEDETSSVVGLEGHALPCSVGSSGRGVSQSALNARWTRWETVDTKIPSSGGIGLGNINATVRSPFAVYRYV